MNLIQKAKAKSKTVDNTPRYKILKNIASWSRSSENNGENLDQNIYPKNSKGEHAQDFVEEDDRSVQGTQPSFVQRAN